MLPVGTQPARDTAGKQASGAPGGAVCDADSASQASVEELLESLGRLTPEAIKQFQLRVNEIATVASRVNSLDQNPTQQ